MDVFKLNYITKQFAKYAEINSMNSFVVDALKILLNNTDDKTVNDFILQNENKINSIRNWFSYYPSVMGRGKDGIVFDIATDKILKFFTSSHSFHQARLAEKRLYQNSEFAKHEPMIYDIGLLGKYNNQNIYYYVMEKFENVDAKLSHDSFSNLDNFIKFIQKLLSNSSALFTEIEILLENDQITKAQDLIKLIKSHVLKQIQNSKFNPDVFRSSLHLADNWLSQFLDEAIMKWALGANDFHANNVGITKHKQLRIFDPSI
jgi:hypothetical protein